jgi:hypothetical protein
MMTLRTPEEPVPADHPLRAVKPFVDELLAQLGSGRPLGGFRGTRFKGIDRTTLAPQFVAAADTPLRIDKLSAAGAWQRGRG